MAEEFYPVPENPEYNAAAIRKIQDTDPVQASTIINPVVQQMISNTHAVKKQADQNDQNFRTMTTEVYNPEATYNAGAYCIHNGKLYKAQVNISEPEAWTESHWIVTSVGEELQELDAALSNKVSVEGGTIADTLNNAVLPGRWTVAVPSDVPGNPIQSQYETLYGFLDVFLQSTEQWILQVFSQNGSEIGEGNVYFRKNLNNSGWTKWYLFAIASPPQEYNLSLAEGITTTQHCVYYKNQFDEVSVRGVANGDIINGTIIATLPVGFRPAYAMELPATFAADGDRPAGTISVNTDGTIRAQVVSSSFAVIFSASFIAEN